MPPRKPRTIMKVQIASSAEGIDDLQPVVEEILADMKAGLTENEKDMGHYYVRWEIAEEAKDFTITPGRAEQ